MQAIITRKGGGVKLEGDASPNDVRQGKKFLSSKSKEVQTGTLAVIGPHGVGQRIGVGNNTLYIHNIPEGIYEKNPNDPNAGNHPEVGVPSNLLGNATVADVKKGKTFTSQNGAKIMGTNMANAQLIPAGLGQTFDIKTITDRWKELKPNNFLIDTSERFIDTGWTAKQVYPDRGSGHAECELVKSYNASTGILTAYLKYKFDYRDSNNSSPRTYDKKINVSVYVCIWE